MNSFLQIASSRRIVAAMNSAKIIVAFTLATGTISSVRGQGQIASGTIGSSGNGPFTYTLSFSDAAGATSPIGSVWYAWVPGLFFLPGVPTSASAPAGWTATVFSDSVQFLANSPANYINPGQSLSGFSYQASFSPVALAGAANSGVSVAYSAGLFSDVGNTFTVQSVPEPSSAMLLISGGTLLWVIGRRKSS
jgi:hypothetical protein